MAILNTRNVFGPTAWAPVVNNVVALATLAIYAAVPGELSVDPVRMGNAKLLVLAIGTTLGVFAQTGMLLVALRRQRIDLRPSGASTHASNGSAPWPPRWCSTC